MDSIQILVATMNQTDFSKVEQMNIKSDVIFANQANRTAFEKKDYNDFNAQMITTETRGVGVNRNLALLYATGDILLLADDDMVYADDYVTKVKNAFRRHPDADAIIFNIETIGAKTNRRINVKESKVAIYNALNYGAARIAIKHNSLLRERICFSTCFGGGSRYSAGEDSLFICDMLKHGFHIYTSADVIATVDQTTSTWFCGYTEKYFYDKGVFYGVAFRKLAIFMCLQDLIRHKDKYDISYKKILYYFRIMLKGCKNCNFLKSWNDLQKS